jgi:pimeloyl-ACP methyl ester carboxylesterase
LEKLLWCGERMPSTPEVVTSGRITDSTLLLGDGRTLGFCEWGVPDGRPVFFLHGTPGSRLLRHAGSGYVEYGLRVVTYDRPGYGRSTPRTGAPVAGAAADVAAIADHLGLDRFGVSGVSGGGPPALATAARLPDRVTRCLAIVTSAPYTASDLDFFAGMPDDLAAGWQRLAEQGATDPWQRWPGIASAINVGLPELSDLPQPVRAMLLEAFTEAAVQGGAGYIEDEVASTQDWGFDVAEIQAPTRFLQARDDESVPAGHGQWFLAHLPHAELVWVDGDHFGPRDEPEMRLMAWTAGILD